MASFPCITRKEATIHLARCLDAFRKWPLYPVFHKKKPLFTWPVVLTLSESGLFTLCFTKEATIHLAHCLDTFRKWPLYPILQKRSHYSFGPLTRRFPKVSARPWILQKEATFHFCKFEQFQMQYIFWTRYR